MLETYKNEIPAWILNDDSFLFHGSSNISESELDKGIVTNFSFVTQEIVDKVLSIYDKMAWYGLHGGGYAVLCSFSNTDIHPEKGKLFFLGETIQRCKLYASEDFAGGELIRSLFYGIRDLQLYIVDAQIRNDHEAQVERDRIYSHKTNQYNLADLTKEVTLLNQTFQNIVKLRDSYKYGIIFCYKIEETDYNLLQNRRGMGIAIKQSLPTQNLKAKLIFEKDFLASFPGPMQDKLKTERLLIWYKRVPML
jgi:hypothetical protein